MRKLKFRSWNDEGVCVSPDYIDRDGVAHWKENSIPTSSKIVEQFTGLFDRNGNEIFEGDILVKWEEDYDFELTDENPDWPIIQTIKDVATMNRFPIYWLENESFGFEGEDLERPSNWEVIGNIHQSPELLA